MKKRIINLDVCRVLAIFSIMFNHALNSAYDASNYTYWLNSPLGEKIFILVGYVFSRIGVPIFLMITGALILKKEFNTKEDIKKFYQHNLLSLVITICLWNVIYYFFNMYLNNVAFSLKELLYILLFMKNSTMPHMWYMPMIIGMYIFLPYVSLIVKKFDFKTLIIPLGITLLTFFILPNIKVILNFFGYNAPNIKTVLDTTFAGGTYGIYIILGYYLWHTGILKEWKSVYLIVLSFLGFASCMLYQMLGYINHSKVILYYNFTGLLVLAVCLFELIRRTETKKMSNFLVRIIEHTSIISLALYFVHRPILFLFRKYWLIDVIPQFKILIYYLVAIIISIIVIELFKNLKLASKYLFSIKR